MRPRDSPPRRRRWRWVFWLVVSLIAAPPLLFAVSYPLSSWWLRHEDAAWARDGLSMDELAARFPPIPDNATSLALDDLTRPIGIRTLPDGVRPDVPEIDMSADPVLNALSRYATAVTAVHDDVAVAPPPDVVDGYLQRHSAALMRIESLLLGSEDVVFAEDIRQGMVGRDPELLGARRLQEVLMVRAAAATRRGDEAGAARSLEAAWKYSHSLGRRADVMSQLMAMSVLEMQAGLLRRLPHAPAGWHMHLDALDARSSVLRSFQADAFGMRQFAVEGKGIGDWAHLGEPGPPPPDRPSDTILRFVTVPYIRLNAAEASVLFRTTREGLPQEDPCAFDAESVATAFKARVPWWDPFLKDTGASFGAWAVVGLAVLDREFTQLIVEARERRAATGTWGTTGAVPSKVCPGWMWIQEQEADRFSIAPSGDSLKVKGRRPWPFVLRAASLPVR